jgi:peptidoglycan/LPS O-acetylase OafA/YrhL
LSDQVAENIQQCSDVRVFESSAKRITETVPLATGLNDGRRLVFIDSLRGIAAVLVLLYHSVMSPLNHVLVDTLPHWYVQAISYGHLGVEMFFVISGFVIAYALRHTTLTPSSMGRFIVRRQIRLDPPYWVLVFVTLAIAAAEHRLSRTSNVVVANTWDVALNLFYVHRITGAAEIVGVAWTLCIEIQFYLVFVVIMYLTQRGLKVGLPSRVAIFVMLVSGVLCLTQNPNLPKNVWFLPYWPYFVGGTLCYWSLCDKCPQALLGIFVLFMGAATRLYSANLPICVGAATLMVIFVIGRLKLLPTLFGGAVFQYLGRISYSLYLVHWPIRGVFGSVGRHLTGERPVAAAGWYILTILSSFLAAHLLYTFVERPSMLWASALKGRAHASHRGSDPVIDS